MELTKEQSQPNSASVMIIGVYTSAEMPRYPERKPRPRIRDPGWFGIPREISIIMKMHAMMLVRLNVMPQLDAKIKVNPESIRQLPSMFTIVPNNRLF